MAYVYEGYDMNTWAARFRKTMPGANKFVRHPGMKTGWIIKDIAEKAGIKVNHSEDGSMTVKYFRSLDTTTPPPLAGQETPSVIDPSTKTSVATKPFALLKLPAELRVEILGYLVEKTLQPVYLGANWGRRTGMLLPNIVTICKLLRAEYLTVAIEQTTYSIHSYPGNLQFQRWLASTDLSTGSDSYKDGFDAIKSLDFPYFSRFPHSSPNPPEANSDIALMLKCKNLEAISLNWVGTELLDLSNPQPTGKSIAVLRSQFRLDPLLWLKKLKRVDLVKHQVGVVGGGVLEGLAAWITANAKDENGKRLVVGIR